MNVSQKTFAQTRHWLEDVAPRLEFAMIERVTAYRSDWPEIPGKGPVISISSLIGGGVRAVRCVGDGAEEAVYIMHPGATKWELVEAELKPKTEIYEGGYGEGY